ncbi:MAG: hypothetical protein ACJ783_23105, partial [Myxococcales bacterium]
ATRVGVIGDLPAACKNMLEDSVPEVSDVPVDLVYRLDVQVGVCEVRKWYHPSGSSFRTRSLQSSAAKRTAA